LARKTFALSDNHDLLPGELDEWNRAHPTGTPVWAWPGTLQDPPLATVTRSEVWRLDSGQCVVAVDGYAGGIGVGHVQARETRGQLETMTRLASAAMRQYSRLLPYERQAADKLGVGPLFTELTTTLFIPVTRPACWEK